MTAAVHSEPGHGYRTGQILVEVRLPDEDRSVTLPCAAGERIYKVAGRAAWMLDLAETTGPGWTLTVDWFDFDPLQTIGGLIQDGASVTLIPEP